MCVCVCKNFIYIIDILRYQYVIHRFSFGMLLDMDFLQSGDLGAERLEGMWLQKFTDR